MERHDFMKQMWVSDVVCVTLPFNIYLLGVRPSEGGCEVCMLLDGDSLYYRSRHYHARTMLID